MAALTTFVAYYRVSTVKQGLSGLGLDAQRAAIQNYLNGDMSRVLREFTEVESGTCAVRPQLDAALAYSRTRHVPIIVAKVDRLTRSVSFISRLIESGAEVRFADMPALEGPTGRFMLQQMAAVAELEAGLISARTKAALAAAKARGQVLGGYRGAKLTADASAAGRQVQSAEAVKRALDLAPIIRELGVRGIKGCRALAAELTAMSIPTARGKTDWSAIQVRRVLTRMQTCSSDRE